LRELRAGSACARPQALDRRHRCAATGRAPGDPTTTALRARLRKPPASGLRVARGPTCLAAGLRSFLDPGGTHEHAGRIAIRFSRPPVVPRLRRGRTRAAHRARRRDLGTHAALPADPLPPDRTRLLVPARRRAAAGGSGRRLLPPRPCPGAARGPRTRRARGARMTPHAENVHWLFATGFLVLGLCQLSEALVGTAVWEQRRWRAYLWPSTAFGMGLFMWPVMVFFTSSTLHMLAHGAWAQ